MSPAAIGGHQQQMALQAVNAVPQGRRKHAGLFIIIILMCYGYGSWLLQLMFCAVIVLAVTSVACTLRSKLRHLCPKESSHLLHRLKTPLETPAGMEASQLKLTTGNT